MQIIELNRPIMIYKMFHVKHKKQLGYLFIDDLNILAGFISAIMLGMAIGAFIIRWKYGILD